jgi:phage/plasmid-like protein (TIGR03299 family)
MSRETLEWLNRNVLVGFTTKRGNAWHYRAEHLIGQEPNHYPHAIPVADVERRLFNWEPVSAPVYAQTGLDEFTPIPSKQRIYPSDDPNQTMGIFSSGYVAHGYSEWLIGNVSNILSDTLSISSAGLLRSRAVAWVEISVPENVHTPEGVVFRPNLVATTSLDGTISTTYKRTTTLTVCDNTLAVALSEKGQQTYKRRHTTNSNSKAEQDKARLTLDLLSQSAEETSTLLTELCNTPVSPIQFKEVLRLAIAPTPPTSKTGLTITDKKISEITALYTHDPRVAPWSGTAFGVVQAFNTWNHHVRATRGDTNRVERNLLNAIDGTTDKADTTILSHLHRALQTV